MNGSYMSINNSKKCEGAILLKAGRFEWCTLIHKNNNHLSRKSVEFQILSNDNFKKISTADVIIWNYKCREFKDIGRINDIEINIC